MKYNIIVFLTILSTWLSSCNDKITTQSKETEMIGEWIVISSEPVLSNDKPNLDMKSILTNILSRDLDVTVSIRNDQLSFFSSEELISTAKFSINGNILNFDNGQSAKYSYNGRNQIILEFEEVRYTLSKSID